MLDSDNGPKKPEIIAAARCGSRALGPKLDKLYTISI